MAKLGGDSEGCWLRRSQWSVQGSAMDLAVDQVRWHSASQKEGQGSRVNHSQASLCLN